VLDTLKDIRLGGEFNRDWKLYVQANNLVVWLSARPPPVPADWTWHPPSWLLSQYLPRLGEFRVHIKEESDTIYDAMATIDRLACPQTANNQLSLRDRIRQLSLHGGPPHGCNGDVPLYTRQHLLLCKKLAKSGMPVHPVLSAEFFAQGVPECHRPVLMDRAPDIIAMSDKLVQLRRLGALQGPVDAGVYYTYRGQSGDSGGGGRGRCGGGGGRNRGGGDRGRGRSTLTCVYCVNRGYGRQGSAGKGHTVDQCNNKRRDDAIRKEAVTAERARASQGTAMLATEIPVNNNGAGFQSLPNHISGEHVEAWFAQQSAKVDAAIQARDE
jgi:hypothetical protein